MTNVRMTAGVEFRIGWRFKLDAETPKDISGYAVKIQIRDSLDSQAAIDTWTAASAHVTVDSENGAVDLLIPGSVTSSYNFCKAVMDCWILDAAGVDGDRSPLTKIQFDEGATRP